jgi:hypothetical protein
MAAGIQAKGETLEAGASAALFQTRILGGRTGLGLNNREQYAVASDGRFLMNVTAEESSATPITIVTNWPASLKK